MNLTPQKNVKPNNNYLLAVFDEDFVFEAEALTLGRHILEVILYDFHANSRHHSIGGVKLPLSHVDISEKCTLWKMLVPCSEQDAKVSNVDVFICFVLNLCCIVLFLTFIVSPVSLLSEYL
jgi:hypothetical protein